MGKVDIATKQYMSHRDVIADAFNFYIYDGRQIIKPEKTKINNSLKLVSKFGITHKEKRQVLLHFTFLKSGCKFV